MLNHPCDPVTEYDAAKRWGRPHGRLHLAARVAEVVYVLCLGGIAALLIAAVLLELGVL